MDQALGGWRLLLSSHYRVSFLIICLCEAVPAAAAMIYGTILPATLDDIGGIKLAAWATQVYAVAGIVGAAAMGRAITRFGFLPVAAFAGLSFIIGSLICAWSPNFNIVLLGRAPQGFGAGLIGALGYALVKPIFPQIVWTRIFAALSAVWGVAAVSGPALGAAFIGIGGWRAAFYALAVIGIFLTLALIFIVGQKKLHEGDRAGKGPPLARLTVLGLGTFLIAGAGIAESTNWRLILVVLGVGALLFLFQWDRRATQTLLPRESFDIRSPLGVLLLLCFCMSLSEMSYSVYGALMLHKIYGFTDLQAGYGLVAFAMGWTFAEILSAHAPPRYARYILALGPVLLISGMTLVAYALGRFGPGFIVLGGFIMGSAMGVVWPHLTSLALQMAKGGDDAVVAGAVPTLQRLGFALGAAIAGVLANSSGLGGDFTAADMVKAGQWAHVGMMPPLAFILALLIYRWSALKPQKAYHSPSAQ